MTKLKTTFEFCMDVVNNGYFDDTKLMPQIASGRNMNGALSVSSAEPVAMERGRAAASPPASGFTLTHIPDTEYSSRPWRNK
ncbi:MAG: hypothetical protein WA173_19125 [Pseudomonas sp.]|uniref:hypothetical protein n=1 Tax=Pseudomonas sp. TaxID=306 RepID=UPI003BB6B285